jgi:cob(I)alamin adenosyltransferase
MRRRTVTREDSIARLVMRCVQPQIFSGKKDDAQQVENGSMNAPQTRRYTAWVRSRIASQRSSVHRREMSTEPGVSRKVESSVAAHAIATTLARRSERPPAKTAAPVNLRARFPPL